MRQWSSTLFVAGAFAALGFILWRSVPGGPLEASDGRQTASSVLDANQLPDDGEWDATSDVPTPRPKAVVDVAEYDFGFVEPGTDYSHTFTVRNEGDAPLTIQRGPTTCKCTMSDLPTKPIPPGAAVSIRIGPKDRQEGGFFSHTGTFLTNDPDHAEIKLKIIGVIRSRLAASPPRIIFSGLTKQSNRSASAILYSQIWDGFEISGGTTTLKGLQWEVQPCSEETLHEYHALCAREVRITLPEEMPSGAFRNALRLQVTPQSEGAVPEVFDLEILTNVSAGITVSGRNLDADRLLRLGTLHRGQGTHESMVLKVQDEVHRRLEIRRIATVPEFLRVSVAPYNATTEELGLYRIDVDVPDDAPPCSYRGRREGEIRIETDHPLFPVLKFKVALVVLSE